MTLDKNYFRNRYKKTKQKYVNILGGKCSVCGSIKNLEFHHIDKDDKEVSIGKIMSFNETTVLKELKKCVLLCHNCHVQHHKNDGTFKKCGGRKEGSCGENSKVARKVVCVETGKEYGCISDCARDMGFHPYRHKIYVVCKGIRKAYKGYTFKYI